MFFLVVVSPAAAAALAAASLSHKPWSSAGSVEKFAESVQRLSNVTPTVNVVEPLPVLPALSMALAERVFVPRAKEYAGPEMLAQVVEAIPDRLSAAVQVIVTLWSTVYVPAFPV